MPRRIFNRPRSCSSARRTTTFRTSCLSTAGWFVSGVTSLDQAAADFLAGHPHQRTIPMPTPSLPLSMQKQGKTNEAVAQFGQAIALKPDYAPFYRGRAELLSNRPDATPAHRHAAQADLKTRDPPRGQATIRSWPATTPISADFTTPMNSSTTRSRKPSVALRCRSGLPEASVLAVSGPAPVEALR